MTSTSTQTRTQTWRRMRGAACLAAVGALVLAGCGGGDIKTTKSASGKTCGTVNIAVNPWVGYTADAYVVGELAKKKLGCNVVYKNLAEEPSWAGFASGAVDVVLENWGHDDLKKKYIQTQHVAEEGGQTGNIGVIGWFVPPWMVKKYPGITNWKNLNKYAHLFKTSESGGKGAFLDGDPSYVTNDAALVKNLKLNFKVVFTGSEAALITAYRTAQQQKKPVIGYFYSPQWFLSEVAMKQVKLPKYTPGCDSNTQTIKCGYPLYHLDKIVATKFAKSGSPAYDLIKNFHWNNQQQDIVAKYIAQDKMSPAAAADKWIAANSSMVKSWLS